MDYSNIYRKVMLTYSDMDARIIEFNKVTNKVVKDSAIAFADWLRYNDEIFEKYAMNKISLEKLYNRFKDETKT